MFDPSAPHIIILLVVVLLLFGSTRLPGAAEALGKSLRIFKKSVKGLDEDAHSDKTPHAEVISSSPQEQLPTTPQQSQQEQIDALQRKLDDLQRQSAANDGQQGSGSAAAGQSDTRSY